MKKLAALSAIVLLPVALSGCETMNSVGSFATSIDWSGMLPWQGQQETVANATPANETPMRVASEAVVPAPDGLQTDDLRKPFGADDERAVASR